MWKAVGIVCKCVDASPFSASLCSLGTGWDFDRFMQLATVHHLPLRLNPWLCCDCRFFAHSLPLLAVTHSFSIGYGNWPAEDQAKELQWPIGTHT